MPQLFLPHTPYWRRRTLRTLNAQRNAGPEVPWRTKVTRVLADPQAFRKRETCATVRRLFGPPKIGGAADFGGKRSFFFGKCFVFFWLGPHHGKQTWESQGFLDSFLSLTVPSSFPACYQTGQVCDPSIFWLLHIGAILVVKILAY